MYNYSKEHKEKIAANRKRKKAREAMRRYEAKPEVKERAKAKARNLMVRYNRFLSYGKRRGYQILLSFDEWSELITNLCFYCELELQKTGSGLDRKNNEPFYSKDNVVPCCRKCNSIKGHDTSFEDMIEIGKLLKKLRIKSSI